MQDRWSRTTSGAIREAADSLCSQSGEKECVLPSPLPPSSLRRPSNVIAAPPTTSKAPASPSNPSVEPSGRPSSSSLSSPEAHAPSPNSLTAQTLASFLLLPRSLWTIRLGADITRDGSNCLVSFSSHCEHAGRVCRGSHGTLTLFSTSHSSS
jgi:hypothetical protein